MFHPEGYVSLWRVYDLFMDALIEKFWDNFTAKIKKPIDNEDVLLRLFPADHIEIAMLRYLQGRVLACSPLGQVISLDLDHPSFLLGSAGVPWALLAFDDNGLREDAPDYGGSLSEIHTASKLYFYTLADFWRGLQLSEGTGEEFNLREFVLEPDGLRDHSIAPLFYDRDKYVISMRVFDYMECHDELGLFPDNKVTAKILRPFEGWSLCVHEAVLENVSDLIKRCDPVISSIPSRGGRPPIQRQEATEGYRRTFPDGHGGISMCNILKRVRLKTGKTFTEDTMRRAINGLKGDSL